MTHSGGQQHDVGDRGQRYAVSVFDDEQNKRIDIGWTDSAEMARKLADSAEKKPSWNFVWLTDRHAPNA